MYDLVIVGGGIAGMCAALAASAGAAVVVVDKGESQAGSSPLAQGGLAAAVGEDDDVELHARDTIAAGAGICDADVAHDVCAEGPGAVDWLVGLGCRFDMDGGRFHLAREGGQSVARSVHRRDATGLEIVRALRGALRGRAVERVHARAASLLTDGGRCVGVRTAEGRTVTGGAVLLATGGAGALWGITTNAAGATGDGLVLAMRAGAQLADLEFMQFHPTALKASGAQRVLLTEALRGHGALLVNERGERFVDELAPRHVVTKAILDEREAYLDCRAIRNVAELFPTVMAGALSNGFDPRADLLPVEPAAHYFIGGVAADAWGRTSVPGLLAAGECAATGMHGANRMAGNSLLETVVVGRRVGAALRGTMPTLHGPTVADATGTDPAVAPVMWEGAGPVRDEERLAGALRGLAALHPSGTRDLCEQIVRSAAARLETRGVHVRSDFPEENEASASRSFVTPSRSVIRH